MLKKIRFFLLLLTLCCCNYSHAQEKPVKRDSLKGYRDIERYSKKEVLPNSSISLFSSQ